MKKVSVIVPVHNAELYLEECLDSILNQTIGRDNIQVIAVNDHSSDNSLEILREYEEKNNIVVIELEDGTTGAGNARNAGVDRAEGKYIMFSDSDDFYESDACEIAYKAIEDKRCNFITFNYRNTNEDGEKWINPIFDLEKYQEMKLDIHDYDKSFYVMNSSVCNKIFNREFLNSNDIRFFSDSRPSEDTYFSMRSFLMSIDKEGAYYNPSIIYNYRQRNKSKSSFSNNCSCDFFLKTNEANKDIYRLFKDFNQIEFFRYYYAKSMSYILYRFIDAKHLTDDERVKILEEMRWFYKLSQALNVPACQESLGILLEKIIARQYSDVVNVCKIIAEVRQYIPDENKYRMTKPTPEMYKEIGNLKVQEIPEI